MLAPQEAREPNGPRRGWLPWAGAAAVVVLLLTVARPGDAPPAPRSSPGAAIEPLSAAARELTLPPGLSDLTADEPRLITFAAEERPAGGSPLYRLWSVALPSGALTRGPIVGRVEQLRAAPEGDRLAFLVDGGGLFVLDGFLAGRPTWVAGGVTAFDFAPDGALVYGSMRQRSGVTGRSESVLSLASVPAGDVLPRGSIEAVLPFEELLPTGFAVRGRHAHAWGVRGGGGVLLTFDPSSETGRETRLGASLPLDVSPAGVVLSRLGGRTALVSPTSRRAVAFVPIRVDRVIAWSQAGGFAAAGWRGRDGPRTTFLVSDPARPRPVRPPPSGGPPVTGTLSFSADGSIAAWSDRPDRLVVADPATGRTSPIALPAAFPRALGPVAIR